jgi:hypothetical protein
MPQISQLGAMAASGAGGSGSAVGTGLDGLPAPATAHPIAQDEKYGNSRGGAYHSIITSSAPCPKL